MNDTYKLQLRHGAETRNFSTRDDVIGYINGQLQYGGVSLLPYEPILFFYGADDAKNAIIMVGLPEGKTHEGKSYFLVDTADLKEQIESLDAQYEEILQALKDEDKKICRRQSGKQRLCNQHKGKRRLLYHRSGI